MGQPNEKTIEAVKAEYCVPYLYDDRVIMLHSHPSDMDGDTMKNRTRFRILGNGHSLTLKDEEIIKQLDIDVWDGDECVYRSWSDADNQAGLTHKEQQELNRIARKVANSMINHSKK